MPTAVVGTTATTGCPSGTGAVQIADLSPPARLQIDQQTTAPSLITGSTNQIVAALPRHRVQRTPGRRARSCSCRSTPYDQFAGPEGTTVADGTVNITLNRQKGFPVSTKQQLLVMFVRARKNGEDPLGGISNGRLVSFPVSLG